MPGFDGSGPSGGGSMTGGGRGNCNPANVDYGRRLSGFGRGMRFGRGFRGGSGIGMRRGFGGGSAWNQMPDYGVYPGGAGRELEALKAQADDVNNTLAAINRRITELESSSE